jgi:hypothetical protein
MLVYKENVVFWDLVPCRSQTTMIVEMLVYKENVVFWDLVPCSCGTRSQKTTFFIYIAVKTSNLTLVYQGSPLEEKYRFSKTTLKKVQKKKATNFNGILQK